MRTGDESLLTADQIRELLVELGDELAEQGESGELFVVGGAALAIAYGAREATRDVDALFEPKMAIHDAATRIAVRHGIPADWLNDAMKGFLHGEDPGRQLVLEHPALRVFAASPRYLLAMKIFSARIERDADDIAFLLDLAGVTTRDEALDLVEEAYSRVRIPAKAALLVEAIFEKMT